MIMDRPARIQQIQRRCQITVIPELNRYQSWKKHIPKNNNSHSKSRRNIGIKRRNLQINETSYWTTEGIDISNRWFPRPHFMKNTVHKPTEFPFERQVNKPLIYEHYLSKSRRTIDRERRRSTLADDGIFRRWKERISSEREILVLKKK